MQMKMLKDVMELNLKVAICLAFLFHVGAKSLAGAGTCEVVQYVKCGYKQCPCPLEVKEQPKWMRFVSLIIKSLKTCYCDDLCEKYVNVQCKHGTCNKEAKKCNCFPCWTGISCSKYENRHQPKFSQTFSKINLLSNNTVGHINAVDGDASQCQKHLKCPCAEKIYTLMEGGDDTFSVDRKTGEIRLESTPFKDDYVLVIGVSNEREAISSKIFVQINAKYYPKRESLAPHSRRRRSVSSGTLILTLKPILSTVFYYNIGETITFTISLSHNSSVTAVPASDIKIRISSEFLTLKSAGITVLKTGSFTTSEAMNGDILELSLSSSSFASGNTYSANVTTTVKNSIGPLSSLKLSAELNATSNIHLKATSNPIVHAVYPKVNLTQSTQGAIRSYATRNFSMVIEFPKLNYSLIAELTTNIQDFICMQIQNVQVKNKGASVQYNGTAQPKYYSTNNDGKNDRVVIDFGFLRNNADTQNKIEIVFTINVLDHALLVNNTIQWVGVGLQAGLRVLWVEQQALTIIKEEPTLELQLTATNFTNTTRLYIGDNLPVSYTIKHTNTSTATASDVKLTCVFENLVVPYSEITADKVAKVNDTAVDVKHASSLSTTIALGSTQTGSFNLQLPSNVTPFTATKVKCLLAYKNSNGISKDVLSKSLSPEILVGTPSIILTVNGSGTQMRPGETRQYTIKVLLSKMRSPIRFELVVPYISNRSVFHISSVEQAIIGSNIQGLNSSATPQLISSQNNGINNFAIYDLGIGLNANSSSANPTADTISIKFNVILLDHNNVTNGTTQWVGAGLVGKPYMIWVGQISMTMIVPVDSRPWLHLSPSIIQIADSKQYPDYQYSLLLSHKSISNQLAYDTKIRFFLPDYVEFVAMVSSGSSRLTQKQFGGSRFFEIAHPLNFPDSFTITFQVRINPTKFPHTGKVFITTPIYLLYKNRLEENFTLVKLLRKSVTVPETLTLPTVNGLSDHYDKGISWHVTGGNTYTVYVCSDDKAKRMLSACYASTDKGNSWTAMDSRVSCILGPNSDGNLIGIAKNKRAYVMYDSELKTWVSVPESKADGRPRNIPLSKMRHSTGDPSLYQVVGLDHWGISMDGVFMKANGAGPWNKKSIWL